MAIGQITAKKATGNGSINLSTSVKNKFQLNSVTVHFDIAPTKIENLIVKLDGKDGFAYNTVLYCINPSYYSTTDIVFIPDRDLFFEAGDIITATYENTDLREYGIRIVTQGL